MIKLSWSKGTGSHKYKVTIERNGSKKTVQFGNKNQQQYFDNTPLKLYSHLDHKDEERRKRYRERHSKILTKEGVPAYRVKYSPAWFSYNFLWN